MVSNSFSFELQDVSDEIPHVDLPEPTSPVLELIPQVAHIDVHSVVVE